MRRAEFPPDITYIGDGTPQRIVDRMLVRYHVQMVGSRGQLEYPGDCLHRRNSEAGMNPLWCAVATIGCFYLGWVLGAMWAGKKREDGEPR